MANNDNKGNWEFNFYQKRYDPVSEANTKQLMKQNNTFNPKNPNKHVNKLIIIYYINFFFVSNKPTFIYKIINKNYIYYNHLFFSFFFCIFFSIHRKPFLNGVTFIYLF